MLARTAGAAVADLEFVQFHPTAVVGVPGREGFLITEAIRGEGATLVGPDGERFVEELAPRDEVARAIWDVMEQHGVSSVGLDMRSIGAGRFPNIEEALTQSGVDPSKQLIPVAPAAHYMMGGVVSDLNGATNVEGLFVVGESACTGLHGANRLASNSLSECMVFGARAALAAIDCSATDNGAPPEATELQMPSLATREAMWRCAGLIRSREGLEELLDDPYPLAALIARCGLAREESRGAHWRSDFPEPNSDLDSMHAVITGDKTDFQHWL
jgi:L-aspartate oxidase